ncbi:hypothetical protein MNBD_GAMMA26-617 [hydrothermal vent metagenome]|uniref:Sulphur oxidation protein SoxZ domain-containing protein n=1 Tax=hydrothermal vent metagenome TaxID=652676 RepID=A0A3B1B6J7_9ZZZZ
MAKYPIEIRAKHRYGITTISALMTHPMASGGNNNPTNLQHHAHFIQKVTCKYGDTILLTAQWGADMPENPYLSFGFKGGVRGDIVTLNWVDNRGGRHSADATIK